MPTDVPLPEIVYQEDDATLVAALAARGVRHLAIAEPVSTYQALDAATLIARLAGHTDSRLRAALIPLFLRHPELAGQAFELVQRLEPAAADTLRHFYTAAVYLQRLWLSRLRLHLGDFALLPDHFGQAHYQLPAPSDKFGEAGLRSLARFYAARTGFDWLSVYHSTLDLFLQQLALDEAHRG